MIPFVTIDVKKPTSEPSPLRNASLKVLPVTTNSATTANTNGRIKIPKNGMIKGPTNSPIVLPHIPAFVPPNALTPTRLAIVSAAKSKITRSTCPNQNHHGSTLKVKNKPYTINPTKINSTDGIIGYTSPI